MHVGSAPHEVLRVAASSTPCVENPHVRRDIAADNLVENVNVDSTKLREQFFSDARRVFGRQRSSLPFKFTYAAVLNTD